MRHGTSTRSRIVAGVDGTAADAQVIGWAVYEATLRHAELVIVHAWRPAHINRAPYAPPCELDHAKVQLEAAHDVLERAARQALALHPGLRLRTVAEEGTPVRVLLDHAAGADLLVLGRRRRNDVTLPTLGPVARGCVRNAECPVLAVATGVLRPRTPGPQRRVRVPEDA